MVLFNLVLDKINRKEKKTKEERKRHTNKKKSIYLSHVLMI